jgi:hypothetical protein
MSTAIVLFPKREDLFVQTKQVTDSEAIKPGMLLKIASGKWSKQTLTTTVQYDAIVALPNHDLSVDTAFPDATTIDGASVGAGMAGQGVLASGQNVAIDVLLMCDASGALTAASATHFAIARSLEAVNASGGAARIKVAWLSGHIV